MSKEDLCRRLSLPNGDVNFTDAEIMVQKPKMPLSKKNKNNSRHLHT